MFHIIEHSVLKKMYNGVYISKVKSLHCTERNSSTYRLHHKPFLEQVRKINSLGKIVSTKKSMLDKSSNNSAILPKRELTLDLVEKPP